MSQTLLLTYFFYGLAFFAMGLAMLLETGRSPALAEARSLRFLAGFGLLHGTHEWLESYLLQAQAAGTPLPAWLGWFRLALLTVSFVALFLYAYVTLRQTSPKYKGHRVLHFGRLITYELIVIACVGLTYREQPIAWLTLLDGLSRYMLALPAAALAGLALYTQGRQAREEGRSPLAVPLRAAGLSFAVYAAAQLFVHSFAAFPAQYVNLETFLALTGFPIQIVRTMAAIVITVSLIHATQVVEKERQAQLVAAHRARLEALEERDQLRRELLEHVVRSQEDERARIARELDHLQSLNRQMSQSLYQLVHDLRPSHLDDLGLVPALNSLIEHDCQPKGLKVEFVVEGIQQRLDPLVETVLFRVAQEALTNVCRHARAKQARVELRYACDQVEIRITDEGCGFDPSEKFHPPRGWGLAGMRERVESLAGQLILQSAPGKGTVVDVILPMRESMGKEAKYGKDHAAVSG
jgi:signal transduction histidine kinase